MRKPVLTLYGHQYCHLCADMQRQLEARQSRDAFLLELVDIEGMPELESRFGDYVPVLYCDDERVCHYFLDEFELASHLARARRSASP